MKNNYIIYSPLHACIVESLMARDNVSNAIVYMPFGMKYIFLKKVKVKRYFRAGSEASNLEKMIYLIIDFLIIGKNTCKTLHISNDADPFVMLIEKRTKYSSLTYIEEGVTFLSRLQFNNRRSTYGSRSGKVKKIFGIESNNVQLSSKKISKAIVFFPKKLKEINKKIDYEDLSLLLKDYPVFLNKKLPIKVLNPDIMILTQPLTEDGHCDSYQEVFVIENIIKRNPEKRVLIKLHYRECSKKYNSLKKYKNIEFLLGFNDTPYQILHEIIKPKSMYTFISSVLFSVSKTNSSFIRVSMIDQIRSERSNIYKKAFQNLRKDFDDFLFSKEL